MAGLNLRAGAGATGYVGGSGVSAALPPSYAASAAGATISSRAYGVGSLGSNGGPATAALGGTLAAVIGTLVLVGLWWTLPR